MRRVMLGIVLSLAPAVAQAQDEQSIQRALEAPAPSATATSTLPEPPPEAPPPLPRHKGLVLDSSLGVLGYGGQFRHVAPPGPWIHTQLGYEIFDWLMLFGSGELTLTDTSVAEDPAKTRAFPILGFGGGARFTVHVTDRVGLYLQAELGALKADVPKNALANLGFRDAESFNPYAGVRLGVEWYQIDRHFALGLGIGVRDATGLERAGQKVDTPILWDAAASIRYTF